jgi:hypothetical protein
MIKTLSNTPAINGRFPIKLIATQLSKLVVGPFAYRANFLFKL